jgi:glycogen operon protein
MASSFLASSRPVTAPLPNSRFTVRRGVPLPFGASLVRGGVNFALLSHHADAVTLVVFASGGTEPLLELALDPQLHTTGDVWHAFVGGLDEGFEYGFRLKGPEGARHAFDSSRLMLDPYARALVGRENWAQPSERGLRAILPNDDFDWGFDQPLHSPTASTVIYELHVRGFTRDPSSDVRDPGTFAGLVEKIPYLTALGVTAVELMPITEFDETDVVAGTDRVTGRPLVNFWGYHPLAFFAPKASYAADNRAGGQIREFKHLVREFHAAGIEVILDLVFNHTGEGERDGPTSSFRGIDNETYYIADPESGAYHDYTGCGNTLNCNHPVVRDLIIDCLRFWVTEMHVDGFRFDLASVLGRGRDGSLLDNPPLLEQIAVDPVLAHTKLIAEAWDATGVYQVGSFPASGRWAELNGRFRDDVRRFVKGERGLAGAVATRMAGSPDLYRANGRSAHHSINFITSHDGFTLADLVAYDRKHNDDNGERGRDGSDGNDSWNCGWEGPGAPAEVERLRRQQARNLLAILFLSQGVPMMRAGDEVGHSQGGNNNAYCQDSPISWMNWDTDAQDGALLRFVTELIAFRRTHQQLRTDGFLDESGGGSSVEWCGSQPGAPDWSEGSRLVVMRLPSGRAAGDLWVAINMYWEPQRVVLPEPPRGRPWRRAIDTSRPSPDDIILWPEQQPYLDHDYLLAPRSVAVFEA